MKTDKKFLLLFLSFFLFAVFLSNPAAAEVRPSSVAGAFYPEDAVELEQVLDRFFENASDEEKVTEPITCLIVPHAGYVYSGQTAAYGYQLLKGSPIETVILIGPHHEGMFKGAAIWPSGTWKTPLGEVPVDAEMAQAIKNESSLFQFATNPHLKEHSLEVQLPFLQKTLKDFKIVPILISDPSIENCRLLASAIHKNIQGKKAVVIASSDMSHYFPDAVARKMDLLTLGYLADQDPEGLLRDDVRGNSEMCGIAAVITVLELSKLEGGTELKTLKYTNSGEINGDLNKVVGYSSSVIYKKKVLLR